MQLSAEVLRSTSIATQHSTTTTISEAESMMSHWLGTKNSSKQYRAWAGIVILLGLHLTQGGALEERLHLPQPQFASGWKGAVECWCPVPSEPSLPCPWLLLQLPHLGWRKASPSVPRSLSSFQHLPQGQAPWYKVRIVASWVQHFSFLQSPPLCLVIQ